MGLETDFVLWAIGLGALSAASLALGSIAGLLSRPPSLLIAGLTAFGGGALIAALAVELVAPTVLGVNEHGRADALDFAALVLGAVAGGLLFVVLDQILNARGGFLRKSATTIAYFSTRKKKRTQSLLHQLGGMGLLRDLPGEHLQALVDCVRPRVAEAGEMLFDEGSPGDRLYFIADGAIQLYRGGQEFRRLEAGDVLGEIALLTGAPRTARAEAAEGSQLLMLLKEDFDRIRELSPELDKHVRELASDRMDELGAHQAAAAKAATNWVRDASRALRYGTHLPSPIEVKAARDAHPGAPLAIWLGILLDSIPESLVIGAGFLALVEREIALGGGAIAFGAVIPYTLVAGLFLSNFPEAMSSSIGMRTQGWRARGILAMWLSIVVITGVGSGVGYWLGEALPHGVVIGIEGIAAGAMLTMIASTMLPEAVHLGGGNIAGMSTLVGFLAAICFKLLE